MPSDISNKISSIEDQITQLENRRKELIQKNRELERKARTKRLIERGAMLESVLEGIEQLSNDQFMPFLRSAIRPEYLKQTALVESKNSEAEDEENL